MNTILNVGELLEYIWNRIDKNTYTTIGIKTYDDRIYSRDENNDLMIYIDTWRNSTDNFSMYSDEATINDWFYYAHEYYINNINSNLSPFDLHKKLKSMTRLQPKYKDNRDVNYELIVKHCVIISEIPIKEDHNKTSCIKSLRFYFSETSDEEYVRDRIL